MKVLIKQCFFALVLLHATNLHSEYHCSAWKARVRTHNTGDINAGTFQIHSDGITLESKWPGIADQTCPDKACVDAFKALVRDAQTRQLEIDSLMDDPANSRGDYIIRANCEYLGEEKFSFRTCDGSRSSDYKSMPECEEAQREYAARVKEEEVSSERVIAASNKLGMVATQSYQGCRVRDIGSCEGFRDKGTGNSGEGGTGIGSIEALQDKLVDFTKEAGEKQVKDIKEGNAKKDKDISDRQKSLADAKKKEKEERSSSKKEWGKGSFSMGRPGEKPKAERLEPVGFGGDISGKGPFDN